MVPILNQESKARHVIGSGRETTTFRLLKEYSVKQSPNELSLFPLIHTFLSFYLKSIYLQYIVMNTETQSWSQCRKWGITEFSALNGTYITHLFSRLRDHSGRRERKSVRTGSSWWLQGNIFWTSQVVSHMHLKWWQQYTQDLLRSKPDKTLSFTISLVLWKSHTIFWSYSFPPSIPTRLIIFPYPPKYISSFYFFKPIKFNL